MNYSTDVKFSNDLIKKGKTTITYSGSLFRTGSEAVTLVYGFGDNWEHTTEKEMTKNENNFSVEIDLLDYDKINFCFRNSNNIWDNNNYLNYIAPIAEPEQEYNFIINENLMPEMLNNLFETDLSTYEKQTVSQAQNLSSNIDEGISIENIVSTDQLEETPMELIENSIVSEESFEIEIPEDVPADIQEFMGEVSDETSLARDLELAFSPLLDKSQDVKKEEIVNFDMDSLVDEILSPIIEARTAEVQDYKANIKIEELDIDKNFLEFSEPQSEEEKVSIDTISSDVTDEIQEASVDIISSDVANEIQEGTELGNAENSLIEVKEADNPFLVSPRSLNKFYILKKRIKLAFYKLFTAIPKIIESAFNEEKN